MAKKSFWDHPIDTIEEALSLKKQIHALQARLSSMFGSDEEEEPKRRPGFAPAPAKGPRKKAGRRTMSPEAREKIAAAQRARWAKSKGTSSSTATTPARSAKPARQGKRTMSPETKAKMAAAMKARWALAKKKGLPGPNARK